MTTPQDEVFAAIAQEAWELRLKSESEFKRAMERLESDLSPDEKLLFLREYGKRDLLYFGRDIIGNKLLTDELHGDLSKFIYQGKNWKLFLLPRDSLKTTFLTQIASLHAMIRNPDARILINSEIHENSKAMLRAIKGTITGNETFVSLYGDLVGASLGLPWTDEELVIATRKNLGLKEASLETAGLDVVKVSRHFTRIIHDDLHSLKNTRTIEQMDKVKEIFRMSLPLLEKDGELWVIGTRWDDQDLYGYIQDELADRFDTYVRSAESGGQNGGLLYPERLDQEYLLSKKSVMTPYEYSCQYLNEPIPKSEALLWPERIIQVEVTDASRMIKGIAIDPSLGETRHSDYTAVIVGSMSPQRDLILHDGWFDRVTVPVMIQRVIDLAKKHRPLVIGCEKSGLNTIANDLKRALREARIPSRFVELKPQGRNKETRIMSLQVFLANDRFKVLKTFPVLKELQYQLGRFPRAKYDDLADAVAYLPDILSEYAFVKREKTVKRPSLEIYRNPYTGY